MAVVESCPSSGPPGAWTSGGASGLRGVRFQVHAGRRSAAEARTGRFEARVAAAGGEDLAVGAVDEAVSRSGRSRASRRPGGRREVRAGRVTGSRALVGIGRRRAGGRGLGLGLRRRARLGGRRRAGPPLRHRARPSAGRSVRGSGRGRRARRVRAVNEEQKKRERPSESERVDRCDLPRHRESIARWPARNQGSPRRTRARSAARAAPRAGDVGQCIVPHLLDARVEGLHLGEE